MSKPKPPTRKSPIELAQAKQHVDYERVMLKFCDEALRAGGRDGNDINALLESFTIHARALVYFLFTRDVDRNWDDDMVAEQFINPADWPSFESARGLTKPAMFEPVGDRINKEVAHLTFARVNLGPVAKGWDTKAIASELLRLMDVFEKHVMLGAKLRLPPDQKPWTYEERSGTGMHQDTAGTLDPSQLKGGQK